MKQEWFESNDFVKTTSKNKPDEQVQDVADKAEETIADLDTPIEKILSQRRKFLKLKSNWKASKKRKLKQPEDK